MGDITEQTLRKLRFVTVEYFQKDILGVAPKAVMGRFTDVSCSGAATCKQRQGLQGEAKDGVLMWTYV